MQDRGQATSRSKVLRTWSKFVSSPPFFLCFCFYVEKIMRPEKIQDNVLPSLWLDQKCNPSEGEICSYLCNIIPISKLWLVCCWKRLSELVVVFIVTSALLVNFFKKKFLIYKNIKFMFSMCVFFYDFDMVILKIKKLILINFQGKYILKRSRN